MTRTAIFIAAIMTTASVANANGDGPATYPLICVNGEQVETILCPVKTKCECPEGTARLDFDKPPTGKITKASGS